jgi:hypothetical protein
VNKITIYKAILLFSLTLWSAHAQTMRTFEGIHASQIASRQHDVDANGAVGTKQYMEWVNVAFQGYDKTTFAPVWSVPQAGTEPFRKNNMPDCTHVGGDGIINFDRLASRWVIGVRSAPRAGTFYYCVAISNTDDLTSSTLRWYTYQFALNPVLGVNRHGRPYFPDWPKLGTWADAYYVSMDLNDVDNGYEQIGVVVCALDRTNMLTGSTPRPMQSFSDPDPIPVQGSVYLRHSLIPADVEGTAAPPRGRPEFLVSIQNPLKDGHSTTSSSVNLWDFHVDWTNAANSTFRHSMLRVPTYSPGCYQTKAVENTFCIPESMTKINGVFVDSVGDRLMPRLAYRNFGTYESFLVSHTIRTGTTDVQTGIRWYELRGSGTPAIHQSGTINPDTSLFRFMPSIAQDRAGNAAAGYNVSNSSTHPGIKASWWNLSSQSKPKELLVFSGGGDEEDSEHWGDYSSMTVDPVDQCTFWYVTEYFAHNETRQSINWTTRIGNFKVSTCQAK